MNPFSPVLLVEDEPNDVTMIRDTLRNINFANPVHVATDGRKALEYIFAKGSHTHRTGGDPLLVLLDLNLPEIRGEEILLQMRADAHLKHVPVVVLTSSRDETELERVLHIGANAFIVKPLQRHDFITAVADLGFQFAISAKPLTRTQSAEAAQSRHIA